MVALFSHASGIIISTACGSVRPPRCSSSSTSSKDAESEAPGVQIGNTRARSPGISVGGQHRLAGAHPVPVAADGVDLAVVRDVAERVGQRPGREGVGGEPGVHDRDRALVALVGEVGEERAAAARWSACPCRPWCGWTATRSRRRAVCLDSGGLVLDPLAGRVDQPVQVDAERQRAVGARRGGRRTAARTPACTSSAIRPTPAPIGSVGHLAPAEQLQALLGDDPVDDRLGSARACGLGGRNASPTAYAWPCRRVGADRQLEVDDLAQELVGTWIRIPAPSPTAGSAPAAPRWSRLISAVTPSATIGGCAGP